MKDRVEIGCDWCIDANAETEDRCAEPVVALWFGYLRACERHDDALITERDRAIDLDPAREAVIAAARAYQASTTRAMADNNLLALTMAVQDLNRLEATDAGE